MIWSKGRSYGEASEALTVSGVTKTYRLTYESIDTMRAMFDKSRVTNTWKINARHLREYVEYFAPKTEQLDIYAEEGKCTFLAFTEKITNGKGVFDGVVREKGSTNELSRNAEATTPNSCLHR